MLPASQGEANPLAQVHNRPASHLQIPPNEQDDSLIYELTIKHDQNKPHQQHSHARSLKKDPEQLPDDSSEYGEVLEVNQMFVKDEQLNREVIKNCHQHIEEDTKIKVFIDPNPQPPPRKETPPKNISKEVIKPFGNSQEKLGPLIPHRFLAVQHEMLKHNQFVEQDDFETVKEERERQKPVKERRSNSKDLRIRQLVKIKHNRHQQAPKTTRKKTTLGKESDHSSHRKNSGSKASSDEEMDSYEQYKEYKRRKDAKGVKNLIKKVDFLEKQVQVLRSEKQELEKMKIISRDIPLTNKKQYGITSNLISIKVDTDHLKEDILTELKKIKQKVDHLDNKNRQETSKGFDQYASMSPVHMTESKMQHTNLILSQARDKSKTGKIFKKSDVRPSNTSEEPKEQAVSNQILLNKQERIENISEIAEAKPRNAVAISKQAQFRKHEQPESKPHQEEEHFDKKAASNFEEVSKSQVAPLQRANSECQPAEAKQVKRESPSQDNKQRRKLLQHKEKSPSPPHENHQQARGFIRSGLKINSFPPESKLGRQVEEMRMLQFDTGKQKFIIDSRNTEQDVHVSKRGTGKEISSFEEALGLLPQVPNISRFPTYDTQSDELAEMGKDLFNLFKVDKINDPQTELRVKKYKNCIYFGIDTDNNILLHYEGRVYFGGWRRFMNGDGEKSGEGIEYMEGKFIYKGQFRDNKRHGTGVLKIQNSAQKSSIFVGQFVDGLKHGEGRQFDESGVIYIGQWKEGKRDGFGRLVLGEKQVYEGTFQKGLKNGHGVQTFENGDKYQGQYVNSRFQGRGRYYWNTGAVYEGEFKNGKRNGKGVWRSSDAQGEVYEGEYKDDLKHGFGVYQWANGSTYEGNFYHDQKHGKGILTHENGKVSKLQWENGNVVGKTQQSHSNSVLSNTNIRNHSRSLPVAKHVYAQKQSERHHKPIPIINNDMLDRLKSSSASNLPKGVSRQDPPKDDRRSPHPEPFMKLYEMSERPMTSKSMSSASIGNFKLERRSQGRQGQGSGRQGHVQDVLPRDPPYKGIRPTTNMINF